MLALADHVFTVASLLEACPVATATLVLRDGRRARVGAPGEPGAVLDAPALRRAALDHRAGIASAAWFGAVDHVAIDGPFVGDLADGVVLWGQGTASAAVLTGLAPDTVAATFAELVPPGFPPGALRGEVFGDRHRSSAVLRLTASHPAVGATGVAAVAGWVAGICADLRQLRDVERLLWSTEGR